MTSMQNYGKWQLYKLASTGHVDDIKKFYLLILGAIIV